MEADHPDGNSSTEPFSRTQRRKLQSFKARELALHLLNSRPRNRPEAVRATQVLRDKEGRPLFPSQVAGSLSHSGNLAAAAVANTQDWCSLGIDIEPAVTLPGQTASIVLTKAEAQKLSSNPDHPDYLDRLIFCAKECTYKAVEPMTGERLGFHDVEVKLSLANQGFQIVARSESAQRALSKVLQRGVFACIDGYLVALLALKH